MWRGIYQAGKMAEFVLGCVQLGLAYGAANRSGKPSRVAALDLLGRAMAAGIHSFDVARAYGDAEERLGEALAGAPVTIITKLSPLAGLSETDSLAKVVAAVEADVTRSCEALRRKRLDCFLLHRAVHRTAFKGAIWERLHAYQTEGVIDRLGVSVQSALEAEEALADPAVGHIQLPFNLLDWRWRETLAFCARRPDVTVHVRSVFLQGLLAADNPSIWPVIDGVDANAIVAELNRLVHDFGRENPADLCLAYARAQPAIDGVVIGLETVEQLERNLALFAKPALTAAECEEVTARLPHLPEQLLNPALWPKR